jgi:putative endonuclease
MKWYTYLLEASDGSLYTGISVDVKKRIAIHNKGKGSKSLRGKLPVTLKVFWEFENKSQASKEEYRIKKLSREEKLKLIKDEK